ncbi:hypothetical protein B0A48_15690 [Cryoendolithus antarcticus]|uniref:Uncharacterized protein n=1 Tax=Cryoendolithus antarcticus TaxID=1507870 RepID=A0A1V8SHH3_9PEZI|nr:hypothetical protein B0A48_15690 [Cryoendolithus antarcticus]
MKFTLLSIFAMSTLALASPVAVADAATEARLTALVAERNAHIIFDEDLSPNSPLLEKRANQCVAVACTGVSNSCPRVQGCKKFCDQPNPNNLGNCIKK